MFAFGLIYVCSSALEWPRKEPLFESDSNKCRRGQNGATIRVTSKVIIEVRLAALGQIWHLPGNYKQETQQMSTRSDTVLEWLGEGPLCKLVSNKRQEVQTAATIQVNSGHYCSQAWGSCSDIAPTRP